MRGANLASKLSEYVRFSFQLVKVVNVSEVVSDQILGALGPPAAAIVEAQQMGCKSKLCELVPSALGQV